MKRALLILLLLAAATVSVRAENMTQPTFGVEWGYSPSLYRSSKYVYNDEYGTTVKDENSGFVYDGDFFFMVRAGIRMVGKSEMSLLGGIMGIGEKRKSIPLLLRYKYATGGRTRDGALVFADGGIAFPLNTAANRPAFLGRAGGGYRLILSEQFFLDFTASVRAVFDHPCDKPSIRRNDSFSIGPGFGISIGF